MRALSVSLIILSSAGCVSNLTPPRMGFAGAETFSSPASSHDEAIEPAALRASISDHLAELCAPETGFAQGAAGAEDEGLCTGDYAPAYEAAYAHGAQLFAARVEVEQVKAEISAAQRELWALRRKMSLSKSGFSALSGRADDRRAAKAEEGALAADDAKFSASIAALQAALLRAEADIRRREAAGFSGLNAEVVGSATAAPAIPVIATPASFPASD
jgi:hypothetical protein